MKAQTLTSITLLAVLSLLLTGPVVAQGFHIPPPPEQSGAPRMPSFWGPEFGQPFGPPPSPIARTPGEGAGVGATSIPLGQPGLSFRYMQTFGVTEEPYLADGQHLNGPAGLFMDASDRLYVVEGNGHRVLRFNASGTNDLVLGHAGLPWHHDDYLCWPRDTATDASGNIWVVFNPAIKKFDSSGSPLLTIPPTNPWESGNDNYHFNDPYGIAFDSLGRLFVADTGNHRIQVYDVSGATPVHVLTIGVTGQPKSDDTGFDQPTRIAFDGSGRLYVMDTANYRIQRCTRNAGPPETWTCSTFFGVTDARGSDLSHLNWARGIAIRGSDVFVADGINYRVLKCNLSGTCNHFAGTTGERGWDNTHFWFPDDVAVDSSGNVYVSDWDNHRVQKFNSAGGWISTIGVTRVPYVTDATHLNTPWGIAVAPDGSIYVTERWGYRLVKLSAAGVQQWTVGQAGVYGNDYAHFGDWWAGPEGTLAIDAAGHVYVPDTGNHRVQVFNPDGSYFTTLGSYGTGPYQFECPAGVAISPVNGDIFVVDRCNQRIQVYTSGLGYKATLGVLDKTGTDNQHFNWPWGVAVDASGNIYVADTDNHRVQKCTLSGTDYTCTTFAGETGVFGDDFGHLHPLAVAVDNAGRVYVADEWNSRIQVFDSTGAYLTTIGGSWGTRTGELRGPSGIAVDSAGNVYVTDRDNHRIQKFAPGVPGWRQANINGFGDPKNMANTLTVFNNQLYAGGNQIWRTSDGTAWTAMGNPAGPDDSIDSFATFNGSLYLGTANYERGAGIYRSANGVDWTNVVTAGWGLTANVQIINMAVYTNFLYAATLNFDTGGQIWRSPDGINWTQVISDNFGSGSTSWWTLEKFNGHLYVGSAGDTGGLLYRTDGNSWTPVTTNGFGNADNTAVSSLAAFKGYLYAGTRNTNNGAQVWRSNSGDPDSWARVATDGFGDPANGRGYGLIVSGDYLYFVITNIETGDQIYRTADGLNWEHVGIDGWGDSNNTFFDYSDKGAVVFKEHLYITGWGAAGGKIWKRTVTADFIASPTIGSPGTTVTFTNLSGGDVVTTTWNFGDGSAPLVSNAATVTHTYTAPGVYTVTLTVEDGVDTDVRTRARYIQIAHRIFLPLVLRNPNPLIALYDDFSNPSFNGFYNPVRWGFWGDSNYFTARQQGGALLITNTLSTPADAGLDMPLAIPLERTLRQVQRFQARMMVSSGTSGTGAKIQIMRDVNGSGWWTQCGLNVYGSSPGFGCDITNYTPGNYQAEYGVSWPGPLNFDTWYTARIEIDPNTARVCFYLDNNQLGCHTPSNADALKTYNDFVPRIGSWNGQAGATGTRYFDDVYITPAQ